MMSTSSERPLREFVGYIWIGENPGIRLSILARSGEEAKAAVIAEYGSGHVISLKNEEDARRPRAGIEPNSVLLMNAMVDRDDLIGRVASIRERLTAPLSSDLIASGWSEEAAAAVVELMNSCTLDLEAGRSLAGNDRLSRIVYFLDHMGVTGGALLDQLAQLSLSASGGQRTGP
jgi:hypothetical protein